MHWDEALHRFPGPVHCGYPPHPRPFRHRRTASWALLVALCIASTLRAAAVRSVPNVRGLPFTRSYPLEEVGEMPRGARLGFDAFGRLAVISGGFYAVLNDTAWLDIAVKDAPRRVNMVQIVQAPDGRAYYSALGSWGTAELGSDGRLHAHPLVPPDAPRWALTTPFNDVLATSQGVYFSGWNGVVYRDFASHETRYFELSSVATIFAIGDNVYVSAHGQPIQLIDLAANTLRPIEGALSGGVAVEHATALDDTQVLVAARSGDLFTFDGRRALPWSVQQRHGLSGRVLGLAHLVDGGTAVAISGKGLFIFTADGELATALTTPQYLRINDIETREAGVLWVATEDSIEKVLYNSAVTIFGQRLGLSLSWPSVVRCDDRLYIASSGELFEAVPETPDSPARFVPARHQIPGGAWAVAAKGPHMLIGNSNGVFSLAADGTYAHVAQTSGVANLTLLGDDLCFAIGEKEIAVLRWSAGRWVECAPRIAGVGLPSVAHAAKNSVWIELGANRLARLALRNGLLELRLFEDFPWPEPRWVNVGIVDDTIVLSTPPGPRLFFDEKTETFTDAPALARLLDRSPHWIIRVQKDETGTLWAAHDQGIVTFTPRGDDYEIDSSTFDLINARYPTVHLLPGNDVWFSAGRSLYHVERRHAETSRLTRQPLLVSVVDGRTGAELPASAPLQLPFAQNNLSFRFFSGSYAWPRSPLYEFRLNETGGWAPLGSGSFLSFPELREGNYRIEVRMIENGAPVGTPASFQFEIFPPWHRTWPAYGLYGFTLFAAVFGLVRWSGNRARRRNAALEQLVEERTRQLKTTMEKLNAETRNAATLAERDRLAGEIHDSLQQGLSGLMLQLDATLKLNSLPDDVRTRLNVARNMVSFTRHEVQHAVWDMESPLLEDTELGEALRKLTALINPGAAVISIDVTGTPRLLPSMTKHHLLRIAQEAITNGVRHAAPRRISVELDYRHDAVALAVSDDGIGFDPDAVLSKSVHHFGLRGLRTRAKKIAGDLQLRSTPGQGTTIHIVVPLPAEDAFAPHASDPVP